MRSLLAQKFRLGSPLGLRLLATGDAELIEGNTWGDRYWGIVNGAGENRLGTLLMDRRAELRAALTAEANMPRDVEAALRDAQITVYVCATCGGQRLDRDDDHAGPICWCRNCAPTRMTPVVLVPLADAQELAHAVSASLTHGEDSPLAAALKTYLAKHAWRDS